MPEIARLNVTLKELPPAQPASAPPTSAPIPPTPPQTTPTAPADAPPPTPPTETLETPPDTVASTSAEENAAAIPEADMAFPGYGAIRYIVYRGDQGEVGRSELQWQIDDGSYYLLLHTEPSGAAALLHPVTADEESKGHIGTEGIQPDYYRLTSTDTAEIVGFNWASQIIQFGVREAYPIHPDSHDILSLQYQLAHLFSFRNVAELPPSLEFWVAIDKSYELFRFEILGEETLEIPAGIFRTLHLQSVGNNKTFDFWLPQNYQMLPIKTRFTDNNGDIHEQVISEISIDASDEPRRLETDPIQLPALK
jgi:hypothetical protein